MKTLNLIVWLVVVAWARPCWAVFEKVPYDPVTMQFPVSPEEALQAARSWAGDPGLQLNLRGVDRDVTLFEADYYLLESPDLRGALAAKARARGARFRWEAAAQQSLEWFRAMAG